MTHTENPASYKEPVSLTTRMLIGAGIGLTLISVFLYGNTYMEPSWGKFWMIKPLFMVTFAGAIGGLCNYFIVVQHDRWGLNKALAVLISLIIFVIGLWMGAVIGLDGTLWD